MIEREHEPQARPGGRWGAGKVWLLFALGLALASMLLAACGTDPNQGAAQRNQAKLDHELYHASHDLGIPQSMLQPIEQQEKSVESGAGGWNYNYKDAAYHYQLLYSQVVSIEQTAMQTLQKQTEKDVEAFTHALAARRASFGVTDSNVFLAPYQSRLDQAVQDYATAKIPGDYVQADTIARANTAALDAMEPAYHKLKQFQQILTSLTQAGYTTDASLEQYEYNQDVQLFQSAAPAARYQHLTGVIEGQISQLLADQVEAAPYISSTLLESFSEQIALLKSYGNDVSSYQQQYAADQQELAKATSFADYLTVDNTINSQTDALSLPLIQGEAYSDLQLLQQEIDQANKIMIYDPAQGYQGYFHLDYEYSDPINGIGAQATCTGFWQDYCDAVNWEGYYDTQDNISNFQFVEDEVNAAYINLKAMVQDYYDSTGPGVAHATDLTLLQHYGDMQGKVVVVSFAEQVARFYQDGKLVYWSYVTTGAVDLPSPAGSWYAIYKATHITFTSPDPKGSPNWYAPTPINFAIEYHSGGFFLHDAWWRSEFGPLTNLPHYDPAAFNGGSHGCVNFPLANIRYAYYLVDQGEPIITY
ncbi:MAG TPA: L,D-transpeptidase [Ktedonobacterales bacterium]|nr:L,D-transpeptidase [Ktedonobacterales bacterium]